MNSEFEQLKKSIAPDAYIPLLVTYTREDAEINGLRKAKKTDTVDRIPEYFSAHCGYRGCPWNGYCSDTRGNV